MSRVKTQAEIDQEARDEALARQLSEEYERQAQEQQQQQQQQQYEHRPHAQRSSSRGGQDGYPGHQYSMHQQGAPRPHSPRGNQILCGNCRAINNIVAKPEAQQLCGHCHRVLVKPTATPQQQQQQQPQQQAPPAAAPSGSEGGIIQGTVLPTSVQVKCGQCAAVNAIPAPAPAANGGEPQVISFRCGQCQAVNQVSV
jgi:phage FluMu protein Com